MPSGNASMTLAGDLERRRVLPVPPGPVRVSSRCLEERAGLGELPFAADERRQLRRAGCWAGRPATGAAGSPRAGPSIDELRRAAPAREVLEPVRARAPRSETPSGSAAVHRDAVASESSDLAAVTGGRDPRRAVDVGSDVRPSASSTPSPVWRPMRTRTGAPSGQGSAASARWASTRPRAPHAASANTAKNPSPSVHLLAPPWAASAPRISSPVARQDRRPAAVAEGLHQPGRALDVGEQERDESRWGGRRVIAPGGCRAAPSGAGSVRSSAARRRRGDRPQDGERDARLLEQHALEVP